jgi:hypothetical protein
MLSRKFSAAVASSLLSVGLLAGCAPSRPSSAGSSAIVVHPEQCIVTDLEPTTYQVGDSPVTYNFKMGSVTFNISSHSNTMAMKDLAEDGQAIALQMFAKLPPSANCKAPKFGG